MALIPCPKCTQDIRLGAIDCPHCGAEVIRTTSFGVDVNPDIDDALLAGKKIKAIFIYRKLTGYDWGRSKEYIDDLADQYPEMSQNIGCADSLLNVLIMVIIITAAVTTVTAL